VQVPIAWNLIGSEFEKYQKRLLAAAFSSSKVQGEFSYGSKKEPKKAPDILISADGVLQLVFECKAKRLPLTEKVSATDEQRLSLAIGELAKGVFQLVRFRIDLRNKLFDDLSECAHTQFVVLTLDDWVFTGPATKDDVFDRAEDLLRRKNIKPDFDIRDVVFCTASELDVIVSRIDLERTIKLFEKNRQPEFREYSPSSLVGEFAEGKVKWGAYPLAAELDITDLIVQ
jgi:hypothetical protein